MLAALRNHHRIGPAGQLWDHHVVSAPDPRSPATCRRTAPPHLLRRSSLWEPPSRSIAGYFEAGDPVGSGWSNGPEARDVHHHHRSHLGGMTRCRPPSCPGFRTTAWFVPVTKIPGSTALTFTMAGWLSSPSAVHHHGRRSWLRFRKGIWKFAWSWPRRSTARETLLTRLETPFRVSGKGLTLAAPVEFAKLVAEHADDRSRRRPCARSWRHSRYALEAIWSEAGIHKPLPSPPALAPARQLLQFPR